MGGGGFFFFLLVFKYSLGLGLILGVGFILGGCCVVMEVVVRMIIILDVKMELVVVNLRIFIVFVNVKNEVYVL